MSNLIKRVINLKHIEYIILSLLLILGFLVRLYKINNPIADWHSWRQADTASVTRNYVNLGLNLLYPKYHDISKIQTGYFNKEGLRLVEFPVFNLFHYLLVKMLPNFSFDALGRLTSVIFSVFSAFFLFLIGKRYLGKWGGLLSCFFFLFLPFNIYFSRVILPEPLCVFFSLFSLWLFIRYIDSEKVLYLFSSGIIFSLALLIKPFALFYAFPMVYLALSKYGIKKIVATPKLLINFLIFVDLVVIPLLLWRSWIGKHPEGIPYFTWAFNGDFIRFRPAFWRWIFGERIGRLILGIWGLIPFVLGVIVKKKNYFGLSLMLGALIYVAIVATASVRHDYYQILIIPPICLLAAEGSLALWQNNIFNKWLARPILIFSIVLGLGMGWYQVKEYYKIDHPEIIAAGQAVNTLTPKDALVIAPYNGDTAFLYQTKRWGWPVVDDSIENIIKLGATVYVSVNLGSGDTKYVEAKFKTIEKTSQYIIIDLTKIIKK
ncbi:MAG: glycosyltransferase family 39 protein [Candidatus Woesebacteria bacterium]|nr:glycosyltransferase family 39 protein [Candidatus Woesebacteria bacterium]